MSPRPPPPPPIAAQTPFQQPPNPLRIAIIGAGPAGLGAAIALSSVSFPSHLPPPSITIYERATLLREIGAGIRIGYNCWRVLSLLGLGPDDVRGHRKERVLHRNGATGEVLVETNNTVRSTDRGVVGVEGRYLPLRVRRTRLQRALLGRVPEGMIRLGKGLAGMERLGGGGVRLRFEDRTETIADLVIGADGIRSVVRQTLFPEHEIRFTGTTIWRTLIPLSSVHHIPDVAEGTSWWHGADGHVYLSPVDDPEEVEDEGERMFEISCRRSVDPGTVRGRVFSWGVPARNERVCDHFKEFDARPRAAQAQVPEGKWKEFAAFSGPRLDRLIGWDSVALLGHASHPLTGAFGSGAAFALEDGWILAQAIEYTYRAAKSLGAALEIFDKIRSPYYARMYQFLDERKQSVQDAKSANPNQTLDEEILTKLGGLGLQGNTDWIYFNDIEKVWEQWLLSQGAPQVANRVVSEAALGTGPAATMVAA